MIILFLLCYIAIGNATCTTWLNVWEVYRYDTVDEAAMILGLPDYQCISQMNPGINVQFVSPAQQVTVPYVTPISSPGTWITTGCSHILHLREAPTASYLDSETPKKTSQSTVGRVVNSPLTTSSHTSKSTLLPYKPSSIILKSNSASSMNQSHSNGVASTTKLQHGSATTISSIRDSESQSHSTKTVTLTSKLQLTISIESDAHSQATTQLERTSITPPTGIKATETKSTSTHKQSTYPLEKTSDISSTLDLSPSPTRTCHEPDSRYYTHNETQSLYADDFCLQMAEFWQSPSNAFVMLNYMSDNGTHLYMYSLEWLPNCTREAFSSDWNGYCNQIMRNNYLLCINGGMGGSTDSNCIRYRYKPSSSMFWPIGNTTINSTIIT